MGKLRFALLAAALVALPTTVLAQGEEPYVQVDLVYPTGPDPSGPRACLLVVGAAAVGLEDAAGQVIATTLDPSAGTPAEGQRFVPVADLEPGDYRVLIDPSVEVTSWQGDGQRFGGVLTIDPSVPSPAPEELAIEAERHENYYGVWLNIHVRTADPEGFVAPARVDYDLGIDGAFDGEPDVATAWGFDGDVGVTWPESIGDTSVSRISIRSRVTTLDGQVGAWSNPVPVTQARYDAGPPSVNCALTPGGRPGATLGAFLLGLLLARRLR